jgi:hypothetical protein
MPDAVVGDSSPGSLVVDGFSRRTFLAGAATLGTGMTIGLSPRFEPTAIAESQRLVPVEVSWLGDQAPPVPCGVAFGIPWPRGVVDAKASIIMRDGSGRAVPSQAWPMAYWPDGSLKWTGLALAADENTSQLRVSTEASISLPPSMACTVREAADTVVISTGLITATISRTGTNIIDTLICGDHEIACDGRLKVVREDRSQFNLGGLLRQEEFESKVKSVVVEQSGPVRAVVLIKGIHTEKKETREWLPFSVRLYFTAGLASIRMVHTFIYDGQQATDFIKGIGIVFSVPFREEVQNRHIRFATGNDNVFAEPVMLAPGYRPRMMKLAQEYELAQLEGRRIPSLEDLSVRDKQSILSTATWNSFKLNQLDSDSWGIYKRTNSSSSWVHAASGGRARGLAFLGDVTGGLAIGLKRFWQRYPASLQIEHAAADSGQLTVWFWAPDAAAMDMRHYDTVGHSLDVTYEDPRTAERADSYGCANTTEMTLWATVNTPSSQTLSAMANAANEPPLLICSAQHYYDTNTLGIWSLPYTPAPGLTTDEIAASEKQLDRAFEFFNGEVERRRWYGFWDYGDYRRTYDPIRHQWMYDIGGHGWNATELMPNVWLWFAFLRSGRADIFRAAEDMTRNTSEVDVYHIGRFAGVGSRHNVSHWGDGAKEPRITMAYLKRFYYYLTTDERMGDLLSETLAVVEKTMSTLERHPDPRQPHFMARIGPDWQAFASNWLAEWERTGNPRYRDYCLAGMKDIAAMASVFPVQNAFLFDPRSKHLSDIHAFNDQYQFLFIFAGDQIFAELMELIDCPGFAVAWNRLCEDFVLKHRCNWFFETRLTGYAANTTGRQDLEDKACELYRGLLKFRDGDYFLARPLVVDGPGVTQPAVEEVARNTFTPSIATPEVSQWALNLMTTTEYLRKFKRKS